MVRAVFTSRGAMAGPQQDSLVGLTDLRSFQSGSEITLFAVSRGGGWLSSYDIGDAPGQTTLEAQWRLSSSFLQLETTDLVLRDSGGAQQLFLAGLNSTALNGVRVDLSGSSTPFGTATSVSATGRDLGLFTEMELFSNGSQGLAALRSGGLVTVSFGANDTLSVTNISQSGVLATERAADIISTTYNNQTYAFVSYGRANEISMFRQESGTLRHMADVEVRDGFWADRPGAMAAITAADGSLYVVVAASGSSSLTVLQVSANGRDMIPVDHLLDDLGTRFSDASHVTAVTVNGQNFILAAGNDQGISLLTVLPGGRIQHIDAMAADPANPLRGITALEAVGTADGIRVWVSTQTAPYLSEFSIALPNLGTTQIASAQGGALNGGGRDDILSGGVGNDIIAGGAGNDIIVDGAGSDRLTGGTGADLFILLEDDTPDTITDFELLFDRIDLTDFNQLNGLGVPVISARSWGAELRFGEEILEIRTADGSRLSASDFTPRNLILGNRIETDPSAYPSDPSGPPPDPDPDPTPDPDPNPGPISRTAGPPPAGPTWIAEPEFFLTRMTGDFIGGSGADFIQRFGQNDRLFGDGGNDTIQSGAGADSVNGDGGDDDIHGGGENDLLLGGSGFDTITGGDGNDTISGGTFADSLMGGNGNDLILGGDGFDQIFGDNGNDRIWAGASADRVYGGEGDDWLSAGSNFGFSVDGVWGEGGNDTIFGNAGFDLLNGGDGNDWIDGGHQADNIYGEAGNDTLLGDLGFDRLFGGTGDDQLYGGESGDALFGQEDNDTLWGGSGDDRLLGGSGNDILDGGSGNDTLNGDAGFDILIGSTGDDLLFGNFNADVFVFANGHGNDTIGDFEALNDGERIDFSELTRFSTFNDVRAAASQVGQDVLIVTGTADSIRLIGVSLNDLNANDFMF